MRPIASLLFALSFVYGSVANAQNVDVTGTWVGTISVDSQFMPSPPCANGPLAPFHSTGRFEMVMTQSGTSVSADFVTEHSIQARVESTGNCVWTDQGQDGGTIGGTLSGNTLVFADSSTAISGTISGSTFTAAIQGGNGQSSGSGTIVLTRQGGVTAPGGGTCNLQMTMSCTPLRPGVAGTCTTTTLNAGSAACSGEVLIGFSSSLSTSQLALSGFTNTLGVSATQCLDSSNFPSAVPTPFAYCYGTGTLAAQGSFTSTIQVTPASTAPSEIPLTGFTYIFDPVNPDNFGVAVAFNNETLPTCTPIANGPSTTQSNVPYPITWTPTTNASTTYRVEESATSDFSSGVTSQDVAGISKTFQHPVTATTTYFYRVRANSCNGAVGPYSNVVAVVVQAPPPPTSSAQDTVVPFGTTTPVQVASIFIPGSGASGKTTVLDTTFTATTDKTYLTVSPSSGTIPPGGTTVTVTADPTSLPPGANTGTVTITNAATSAPLQTTPVSVSLVTPVASQSKSSPPPNALVIPIVGHLIGGGGTPFQSDVRLTNAGASMLNYQITYTPTRTSSTASKVTTIPVLAGSTVALNDVVKDFFGVGATTAAGDTGSGSLEIRPLNSSSALNFASSRTYATTPVGTFGQFIPAIPFSNFATKVSLGGSIPGMPSTANPTPLSLQQIAQSTKFRTNLGIVEGSGSPASGTIKVYDDAGIMMASAPYSLLAGEQQQKTLADWTGITSLQDGRVEVSVDSPVGAVSAYASVLDNITSDPLAVAPVQASLIHETRYVLPGVAEVNNGGLSNFHSDVRIFNGGTSSASVNLTYFEQISRNATTPGASTTAGTLTILPGHVQVLDNVLPTAFPTAKNGGSLLLTTNTPSSLVVTGRTYTNDPKGGTFGQFIPGVSPSEGIGMNDRPLQILQLEQSVNFRSNIGIAELTGNPVTVRLFISLPDSRVSITPGDITLPGNGFTQLQSFIKEIVGEGKNTYNVRIAVQVVGGTGRITVYGSVIDNATGDPTYVPAQ